MAKLAVTVAVFLFVLVLAHARTPFERTENDVTPQDLSSNLQESDPKSTTTTILLPSEKTEPEHETLPEVEPEKAESETTESETIDLVPVTVVNFRPINRQFPGNPSLTLRHRRPCRQHRMGKPWGPARFHHREISYGNDMLMSSNDDKEDRQPARWVNFHHGDTDGPRFRYWRDDGLGRNEEFKRPRHFHHRHHHHHHFDGEEREREGHEQESGLVSKIRKFLNHF